MNQSDSQSHGELITTIRRMLHESEQQSNRMMTMTNLSIEMSRAVDYEDMLLIVQREAKWLLEFEHCSVVFMNMYGIWESRILIERQHLDLVVKVNTPAIQQVIKTSKSKILDETENDFLPQYSHKVIIPLSSESQVIGTIQFARNKAFEDEDLRIGLFLAYQMASSMDKSIRMQILLMTQQQLADYAKELSVQNEEIETYNHTIAHDLKSPLSMILLKVGLIRMAEPEPAIMKHIEDIGDRVRHMEEMIDQLLVLTQLRKDTDTMHIINSNNVVSRCIKRFPEFETGKVKIDVQPEMPSIIAHAQWVEEIFANLISNAIKYMGDQPAPYVKISAKIEDSTAIFSVSDNGVGIREEDYDKLFKKFTRLRDVDVDGLGLGLSIVHRIVENLGGKLGVDSKVGEGTRFWFTIPVLTKERPSEDPMP